MSEITLRFCGDNSIYIDSDDVPGDCYCAGLESRVEDLEANKQDKLVAGDGITIEGDVISASVDDQNFYTKDVMNDLLAAKQNLLVAGSGVQISGNTISATGVIAVDTALSPTSVNPVQNKVINSAIGAKQDELIPTDGIYIDEYNYIGFTLPRAELDWMPNDTYVTGSGYSMVYTYGALCICLFNLQLVASIPTQTTLMTGLPIPGTTVVPFALCNTSVSAKVRIRDNGTLETDGVSPATAGWYNGCVVYPTTSSNP